MMRMERLFGVHVIFVGKNPILLLAGLRGWFLGTVDSRFRGNDSGVVGVINGETIANGPKNLPTILTGPRLFEKERLFLEICGF